MTRTITRTAVILLTAGRLAVAQADSAQQKTFFTPRDGAIAAAFLAASAGISAYPGSTI